MASLWGRAGAGAGAAEDAEDSAKGIDHTEDCHQGGDWNSRSVVWETVGGAKG